MQVTDEMVRVADEVACRESKTFGYFCGRSERHEMLKVALSAALAAMPPQPLPDREPRVDEVLSRYSGFINERPMLVSLLYDIDMLPEQTCTYAGAVRLAGLCEVWKKGEAHELPPAPSQLSKRDDAERDSRQEA